MCVGGSNVRMKLGRGCSGVEMQWSKDAVGVGDVQ